MGHEKRPRKKKIDRMIDARYAVHRQLENHGFHNEAWAMSAPVTPQCSQGWDVQPPPTPQYVLPPPGLDTSSPPPPVNYPMVNFPAPVPPQVSSPASEAQSLTVAPVSAVEGWTIEKVVEWLSTVGLGRLSESFKEHRITGDVLLELSSGDLEEIGVRAFGDKKRLLRAV